MTEIVKAAPVPCASVPCSKTCVMVHRNPDRADATITMTNPARLNSVSPATSKPKPALIMTTTIARFQLGLHSNRKQHQSQVLARSVPTSSDSEREGAAIRGSQSSPFNPPQEAEAEQEDRCCRFAHGVKGEGDQGQGEVGQANVQPSGGPIGHDCTAQKHVRSGGPSSLAPMPISSLHVLAVIGISTSDGDPTVGDRMAPCTKYCRHVRSAGFCLFTMPSASTAFAITIWDANCKLLISMGAASHGPFVRSKYFREAQVNAMQVELSTEMRIPQCKTWKCALSKDTMSLPKQCTVP